MKNSIASKGLYLLASCLLLSAIVIAVKHNDSTQLPSSETQTTLSTRSAPTKSLYTTSQSSSLTKKVDAEHHLEYDLDGAISAFEHQVRQNSEQLDTRDLELFGELISNLNEFQKNETSR